MNVKIELDKASLDKSLNDIQKKTDRGIRKAVTDVTAATLKESRKQLSELVYNKPIPSRKNGKPAWKRTSNLIRQERMYMNNPLEGVIDNHAPYAEARHELDRPSPVDGVTRRAPWREKAVEAIEHKVKRIAEKALESELKS
jgi:hypothetical protein